MLGFLLPLLPLIVVASSELEKKVEFAAGAARAE